MKKIFLFITVVTISATAVFANSKHNESNLNINAKVSSVNWVGKKVSGEHSGNINIKEGSLHLHDGKLTGGKVIIDMTSITCTDMQGEWAEKLVGHLNSPDFFDVKNNPTATLEILGVTKSKDGKSTIKGNLTIKKITKPIEFQATIEVKDGKLGAYAELKVDRTLYDIKYGSGKFFEDLGDKMIDDNFTVKFKIAAE